MGAYALQRTFFSDQKINYGAYGGADPAGAHEMEQVKTIWASQVTTTFENLGNDAVYLNFWDTIGAKTIFEDLKMKQVHIWLE